MKNRLNSGRPRCREACKPSDSADARKSLLERLCIQLNKGNKNTNKYRESALYNDFSVLMV